MPTQTTTTVILPNPIFGGGKSYSKYVQIEGDVASIMPAGPVLGASNTTPILIAGTNFYAGQVTIAGVLGNTGANGVWYVMSGGNVVSASGATPIVITCDAAHYLASGFTVSIGGVGIPPYSTGSTAANGAWSVTVLSPTTFSLNGSNGGGVPAVGVSGLAGGYSLVGMLLIGSAGSGAYAGGGTISRQGTTHTSNAALIPDS